MLFGKHRPNTLKRSGPQKKGGKSSLKYNFKIYKSQHLSIEVNDTIVSTIFFRGGTVIIGVF